MANSTVQEAGKGHKQDPVRELLEVYDGKSESEKAREFEELLVEYRSGAVPRASVFVAMAAMLHGDETAAIIQKRVPNEMRHEMIRFLSPVAARL